MSNAVKWTTSQQAAIDTRGANLLVAAAAGSGKTAVLVERIIQMITSDTSPVDIDRLLVVTFTKAAASEMKERIGEAISKKIEENPKDKRLNKQLALLNKASITTIHSFCLEVVKNHFHLVHLDPGFRIGDQIEIDLLKLETLEELFEKKYEGLESPSLFSALVESYGGKREDKELQDMVLKLYNFVQSHPWPKQWLEAMAQQFDIGDMLELDGLTWMKQIKETVQVELEGIHELLTQGLAVCQIPEGPFAYRDNFTEDISMLQSLRQAAEKSFEEMYEGFQKISWKALSRKKQECEEALKEKAKSLREDAKKSLEKLTNRIFFGEPAGLLEDLKRLHPLMKALGDLVLEFAEAFRQKKKEKNLVDFNDLEHYCLQILLEQGEERKPSEVALQYRRKFKEVLIDEYQDSNLVQETLLGIVSRKESTVPNLFMVGDVKQSIYRFRLAKPELFLEKYNTFLQEEGQKSRRIDLDQNFRSRETILYGINFIFKQIMSEVVGEMDYDAKAALYPGANYPEVDPLESLSLGGAVELHILEKSVEESKEAEEAEEQEEMDAIQLEARVIAGRIKEMIGGERPFHVLDKHTKNYRPMEYRDVVILLRATQNWSHVFVEELIKENIPAYADASTGYFEAIEVQTIMSLLQIIDNPRQDLPFLTVLRSPMVGLTADQLAELRLMQKEVDFYETLSFYVDHVKEMEREKEEQQEKRSKLKVQRELAVDPLEQQEWENALELQRKLKSFLENLEHWRDLARVIPVDELIQTLYLGTNYYNYVGAIPGGVQRQANLRALIDRAIQYETTTFKGVFHFVRFIEKLKYSNGEMGIAKILGESENVVRIMSIHKSKGLEFPVVFAAGMGKRFNLMDMNQSVLLHQELGFGPNYVDYEKRVQYSTLPRAAIKEKMYKETLSEEMRILYVALTRAKEKLIIVGSDRNIEKKCGLWCRYADGDTEKLPHYPMVKAKNYLDWICTAVARHKDGLLLREKAGIVMEPTIFEEEKSSWQVFFHHPSEIMETLQEQIQEEESIKAKLLEGSITDTGTAFKEEIYHRLSWRYAYEKEFHIPTKITVTEMKRQKMHSIEEADTVMVEDRSPKGSKEIRIPKFMMEKKDFTSAEKGTLLHTAMQHLDFKDCGQDIDIQRQLESFVGRELMTEEQIQEIKIEKIRQFLESSLGKRLLQAQKVYKEVPFMMDTVYEGCNEVLLQGIIDCYFEEEDGIVLLDYKTDRILPREIQKIRERYKVQMDLYAKAVEDILSRKVKEKYLYVFSIGQGVEM